MIPNNPDINDLLTIINKKRKHNKEVIKKEDIIFDLQILSLKKLENMFKDKKLSTRENSKLLNDLEYTMTSLKIGIENTELNKEFDNIHKVMFISLINIYIKEIVDIRKINDNEGRHFNILDYIKNKRTKIENELKKIPSCKRLKKNIINDDDDDDDKKEEEKKKGKENDGKKDDGDENDGEENDGEEDDGEEDDGEENDGEENDGEENDGDEDEEYGEYDEEYGEYGEYDEEEYNFHNKVTTKLGKEFIKQLYRGKGSPYDLENETVKYFTSMNNKERKNTLDKLKEINNYENNDKPIIFQIMELDLPISQKNHILKNYLTIATSRSDNSKLNQWVENVIKIPIGKYKGINLNSIKPEKVKNFLNDLQKSMDKAAYSHDDAKRQIIQMMGQQIRNPKAKGNI